MVHNFCVYGLVWFYAISTIVGYIMPNTVYTYIKYRGVCPHGVMVKAVDCGIIVSEFVPQSCYYVHFRANTLGKGMNPPYPPAMG